MSFKILVKQTLSNRKRHKVITVEKYKCHHGDLKKKMYFLKYGNIFKFMIIFVNN